MLGRQRSGSIVCPNCGRLVGVRDEACLGCGTRNPSLWGFAPALRRLGGDAAMALVLGSACVSLFMLSLALAASSVRIQAGFEFLLPDPRVLILLGASGGGPVFGADRWWTVLSASLLHGGLVHLAFNIFWLRDLLPQVAHLFGSGRTILIWTASSVTGFLTSSAVNWFPIAGFSFGGGHLTVGASAPIFGLLAALIVYGNASGQRAMKSTVWSWVIAGVIFGFLWPRVDNWAHAGGFLGGWLSAKALGPLASEKPVHVVAALVCFVAMAASIGLSIVTGLEIVGR
jgi:rhomboid protease GluP